MLLLLIDFAAARPTDGSGMWTYDDSDTIATYDAPDGRVRVWFSTSGTNATLPDDLDGSGTPDFVEDVGLTSEDVIRTFEGHGLTAPLPDGDRGGDDRLDVYLVDFGGNADGNWGTEDCDGNACFGYFQMENDFSGYGYDDLATAVTVLTSHELFHGVQAAYGSTDSVWFLEGTATWAEDLYEPGSEDFLRLCDAYLADAGRSLYEPPGGPVPPFAYGTALWWWFLTNRYGDDLMRELLLALPASPDDASLIAAMVALEASHGGDGAEDFATFARWNLATGSRAGKAESYPFAAELRTVSPEAQGDEIVDENRFYPLATTYYKLTWEGGPLAFATSEAGDALRISLHAIDEDEDVVEGFEELEASGAVQELGERAAGTYWLVVSNPTWAENSTQLSVCLGGADAVAACAPETSDTGDTADTGDDVADDTGDGDGDPPGCGCQTPVDPGGIVVVAAIAATWVRRRRSA